MRTPRPRGGLNLGFGITLSAGSPWALRKEPGATNGHFELTLPQRPSPVLGHTSRCRMLVLDAQ